MKRILSLTAVMLLMSNVVTAQKKGPVSVNRFADVTLGFGSSQVTAAASVVHNWKLGKREKWEAGLGVRFTGYFASDQYFKTAPAKLTSGKTGPAVLFADDIDANIDSVLFPKAQVNSLNLSFNFGYNVTSKLSVGFNIDAIGFSFGKKQPGTYYANNFATGVPVSAKPTGFNLLLISDNDLGSLASEFFARYRWNDAWAVKLGFEFFFAEYTTSTKVQTTPGGDMNDRFRKKMPGVGIGVTYHFKK